MGECHSNSVEKQEKKKESLGNGIEMKFQI